MCTHAGGQSHRVVAQVHRVRGLYRAERERAAAFANSCTVKNVAEAPFLVSTLKPTVEMVLHHGAVIAIIRFRTQPLTTILH